MPANSLLATVIALSLSISCATPATDSVEIPLKDVWALDMPGTRDVRELEPEIFKDIRKRPSEERFA